MSDPTNDTAEHGPVPATWFGIGCWPTCTCGYNPRNNLLLTQHWLDHGFTVRDEHGTLVKHPEEVPNG